MKFRDLLKKIPFMVPAVQRSRDLKAMVVDSIRRRRGKNYAGKVFGEIYAARSWIGDGDSVSGVGSTLKATVGIRRQFPDLVRRMKIRSLVDAPCGDFLWMEQIVGSVDKYVGVDVVPGLIEANKSKFANDRVSFALGDITSDALPAGDAVMCRDCMIHLSTPLIRAALRNFKKAGYKSIMLSHDESVKEYREIITGDWRQINWRLPPFNFPEPKETIVETSGVGRVLAVWTTSSLLFA